MLCKQCSNTAAFFLSSPLPFDSGIGGCSSSPSRQTPSVFTITSRSVFHVSPFGIRGRYIRRTVPGAIKDEIFQPGGRCSRVFLLLLVTTTTTTANATITGRGSNSSRSYRGKQALTQFLFETTPSIDFLTKGSCRISIAKHHRGGVFFSFSFFFSKKEKKKFPWQVENGPHFGFENKIRNGRFLGNNCVGHFSPGRRGRRPRTTTGR